MTCIDSLSLLLVRDVLMICVDSDPGPPSIPSLPVYLVGIPTMNSTCRSRNVRGIRQTVAVGRWEKCRLYMYGTQLLSQFMKLRPLPASMLENSSFQVTGYCMRIAISVHVSVLFCMEAIHQICHDSLDSLT